MGSDRPVVPRERPVHVHRRSGGTRKGRNATDGKQLGLPRVGSHSTDVSGSGIE